MNDHLKLLGMKAKDKVTGYVGVVECISFDLYGCVQATVRPEVDKKNEIAEPRWFDTKRLTAIGKTPVMELPTFDTVPGGAEKPPFPSRPAR